MFGLRLSPYEENRRDEFLKERGYDALADLEETCEGSDSYHYEVHSSNIGDEVFVVFKGERHYISDPNSL